MTAVKEISGKTKRIVPLPDWPGHGRVHSFNVVSAGDGERMDDLSGKGALANAITCDVFERLAYHGLPVAFVKRESDTFITRLADMISLEIVVRNKATGSSLERNPDLTDGQLIDPPVVEFFYKTTGCKINGHLLPKNDPLALLQDSGYLWLYHPSQPPVDEPLYVVKPPGDDPEFYSRLLPELMRLALQVNLYLKQAWEQQGGDLWDFKIECGWVDGKIVVADVIDFDSWRVFVNGKAVSKQLYRDREKLDAVMAALQLTAKMTACFAI